MVKNNRNKQLPAFPKQSKGNRRAAWISFMAVGILLFVVASCKNGNNENVVLTPEFIAKINQYEDVGEYAEGLAGMKKNGKWGFMDVKGEEAIPCNYDEVHPFSEGRAAVAQNGKWGYIDRQGKSIVPCTYDFAAPYSEGVAVVVKEMTYPDGTLKGYPRLTFLDAQGNVISKLTDMNLRDSSNSESGGLTSDAQFHQGVLTVGIGKGDEDDVEDFKNVNKEGEFVDTPETQASSPAVCPYQLFSENDGNLYGIKDSLQNVVVQPKYIELASSLSTDGSVSVPRISNGVVFATLADQGYPYHEGKVIIHGYIDLKGHETFSAQDYQKVAQANKETTDQAASRELDNFFADLSDNSNSDSDTGWIQGTWSCSTQYGTSTVTISGNNLTSSLDGEVLYNGPYTIEGGNIKYDRQSGTVLNIPIDYANHRLMFDQETPYVKN